MKSRVEELMDDLQCAEEYYGEILTQHQSECALYGDSWPGAQIQIDKAFQSMKRIKAELEIAIEDESPGYFKEYKERDWATDYDIPY